MDAAVGTLSSFQKDMQPTAEKWAAEMGLPGQVSLERLAGGRNNRVFRMKVSGRSFLLKDYFVHPHDRRDRLGHEFSFLQYARDLGLRCVPRPIMADTEHHAALYEFIDGDKVKAYDLCKSDIDQAIQFVLTLNGHNTSGTAMNLPIASEACFSIGEHLINIERRLNRLRYIEPHDAIRQEALDFMNHQLIPYWKMIKHDIAEGLGQGKTNTDDVLGCGERCLSPSDFGFHNALRTGDGELFFIDFEYAGWDDPAKLICDFFCQPDVTVSMDFMPRFAQGVASLFTRPEALLKRVCLVYPLFVIKWCCIMLNEFLPEGYARRNFAVSGAAPNRREAQLEKAEAYLLEIMGHEQTILTEVHHGKIAEYRVAAA